MDLVHHLFPNKDGIGREGIGTGPAKEWDLAH